MTRVERGRHCSSCSKTVVDFSHLSDEKTVAFYTKQDNADTCGNFRIGQLEHINYTLHQNRKEAKTFSLKPFFATALLSAAACTVQDKEKLAASSLEKPELIQDTLIREKVTPNNDKVENTHPTPAKKFEPRKITYVDELTPKDSINEQSLPAIYVKERSNQGTTVIREVTRTAGVPMIHYEVLVKKAPLHKRIAYRLKHIFRRKNKN